MAAKGVPYTKSPASANCIWNESDVRRELMEIRAIAKELRDIQTEILDTLKLIDLQVPALKVAAGGTRPTSRTASIRLGKDDEKPVIEPGRTLASRRSSKRILGIPLPW